MLRPLAEPSLAYTQLLAWREDTSRLSFRDLLLLDRKHAHVRVRPACRRPPLRWQQSRRPASFASSALRPSPPPVQQQRRWCVRLIAAAPSALLVLL